MRDLGNAFHGLSENRLNYSSATITATADNNRSRAIYDLFAQVLDENALAEDQKLNLVQTLLPQIVIGHCLWAQAANKRERFVRVQRFAYLHSIADRHVWITFDVHKPDLETVGVTAARFLQNSRLVGFQQVNPVKDGEISADV